MTEIVEIIADVLRHRFGVVNVTDGEKIAERMIERLFDGGYSIIEHADLAAAVDIISDMEHMQYVTHPAAVEEES